MTDKSISPRDVETQTFAGVLRAAVTRRGVTLAWLKDRLTAHGNTVSMATLSYWRSGARRPEGVQSLAALTDLEDLLNLDRGALSSLLGPSNRTGPLGLPAFPLDVSALEDIVRDVHRHFDAPYPDVSREMTTHSVTDVGIDGFVTSRTTRTVVQSANGLLTGIPYVEMTPGLKTSPPHFTANAGGFISGLYSHPDNEVHGFMFTLDQPLVSPNTAMLEWSMTYPDDYPAMAQTGHAIGRQCRELLLWTRFHPDAIPDWFEEIETTPAGPRRIPITAAGNSVHQIRRGFGPGSLELRWGFGEPPIFEDD